MNGGIRYPARSLSGIRIKVAHLILLSTAAPAEIVSS